MPEPIDPHLAVREILDEVTGEPVAALRSSGSGRLLQPPQYGGLGLPTDEFIWAVCELAAVDGSLGWLAAIYNAAAHQMAGLPPHAAHEVWDANPDALIAIGHRGSGDLVDGRLTGRWESVVGAEQADWLLLPVGHACRVLVPRIRVRVELTDREAGLTAAGVGAVVVGDLAVEDGRIFSGNPDSGVKEMEASSNIAVSCQGVTKTYGTGSSAVQALRGIDLDIRMGELLMLVGPSGWRARPP